MVSGNRQLKKIPIIVSSSNEFSIFIPVLLNSLKTNSNPDYHYEIYVLDSGIDQSSKTVITAYVETLINFSIQYTDVSYYIEKYKHLWYVYDKFAVATYIRFFIPEIFSNLDKAIYLDLDISVKGDISDLFNINIGENAVGAAVDGYYERQTYYGEDGLLEYNKNIVCYPVDYKVFNAGVLIINLKKWRELNVTEMCINRLSEIKTPRILDQCILNSVLCKGLVYELPVEWNYQWHADIENMAYPTTSQKMNEVIDSYRCAKSRIKIIHYTTCVKPWNIYAEPTALRNYPDLKEEFAPLWWEYAHHTPFYEKIILQNILTANENAKKEILEFLHQSTGLHKNSKKLFTHFFKIKKNGEVKRFYLLGLRVGKSIKNSEYKAIYLFNILVYKKKIGS